MTSSHFVKLALMAILFGSLYTIFRKYQSVIALTPDSASFNQPLLQSFVIFLGMSLSCLVLPFFKAHPESITDTFASSTYYKLQPYTKFLYIVPSILDVLGTLFDTAGLYYTSVSVSQMLKGSSIFFTYLISIFYLKQQLTNHKHCCIIFILLALLVIGYSNLNSGQLCNCLIIVSQFLFALMFIYEEKIMKQYYTHVENIVMWEGIWGTLFSGIVMVLFSHISLGELFNCNFIESCKMIYNNTNLLLAMMVTALCIAPFNYFGISITKQSSALHRTLICTCRMVVVWVVSLGLQWYRFHLLQLGGYLVLTYAIYIYEFAEGKRNEVVITDEEYSLDNNIVEREFLVN